MAQISATTDTCVFTLHAYARGKAISSVITKIARFGALGICTCCNYHELVDISKKLASASFKLLNMAH